MILKQLVNNKELYEAFLAYLDKKLEAEYRRVSSAEDIVMIHRAQGEIQCLKKLKHMREDINGRD